MKKINVANKQEFGKSGSSVVKFSFLLKNTNFYSTNNRIIDNPYQPKIFNRQN